MIAGGDHGEQRVGAGTDYGQIAGGFVDDQEHGRRRACFCWIEAHGSRRSADGDGTAGASIDDVEWQDAAGFAIGDVHFAGIGGQDAGCGSRAEHDVVAHFVGPGVDGLQAVGFGRDDVEFAAIGLEKHLRGLAGKVEIGEQDAAFDVDDRHAFFGAAHDKGHRAIGKNDDFFGVGNNRNGGALL